MYTLLLLVTLFADNSHGSDIITTTKLNTGMTLVQCNAVAPAINRTVQVSENRRAFLVATCVKES